MAVGSRAGERLCTTIVGRGVDMDCTVFHVLDEIEARGVVESGRHGRKRLTWAGGWQATLKLKQDQGVGEFILGFYFRPERHVVVEIGVATGEMAHQDATE